MRSEEHSFVVPAGATPQTSDAIPCFDLTAKQVQFGTWTGTGEVHVTADGNNWKILAAAVAPGDIVDVPLNYKFIRVKVAWTAGTPSAKMISRNARSDGG